MKKIAVVCAEGLGDGLLSLVFAHNLERTSYQVTTFSDYMAQLTSWFPNKKIEPFPKKNPNEILSAYDQIISTDGAFLTRMKHNLADKYRIYYECDFNQEQTVLENFLNICQKDFGLKETVKSNGLMVPNNLFYRYYKQRVIIHPMSTSDSKNWPAKKFIRLAEKLKAKNFDVIFIMNEKEQQTWKTIFPNYTNSEFEMPTFSSLNDLTKFIYESGYFIGNDSGIGHLAANLGVPTLSLFARQRVANLWKPNWNNGMVAIPTLQLPGARLRTKSWKTLLTIRKVNKYFEELRRMHEKL